MSHENSVTIWIDGIKAGDGADIQRLWDRYFERLVRLAGAAAGALPAGVRRGGCGAQRLPELLRPRAAGASSRS